jgi:predicted ribosome quality control (RQC) complex YloA/Tae2 family protein
MLTRIFSLQQNWRSLRPTKVKAEKVPTPNIIREKIGKEFELCVGTSAAANDYVTFQLAQPEDLWFHVRDLPGSHVLLRRLHSAERNPRRRSDCHGG